MLARFMPIVRTFVPVVAGMAEMPRRRYTVYNVLGPVLWIGCMLAIGALLGTYIPGVAQHIEPVILAVVFLSLLPGVISWSRERAATRAKSPASP